MKVVRLKYKVPYAKTFSGIAIIFDTLNFFKEGLKHREDGPAFKDRQYCNWVYEDKIYGFDTQFNIKSWKVKAKQIKFNIFQ
jgi:hypothetical protein